MEYAPVILLILFAVVVPAFCVVMMVRNGLVFRAQMRRNSEILAWTRLPRSPRNRLWFLPPNQLWAAAGYVDDNYNRMLWDFRCWTYRQFYPRSVEEMLAADTPTTNPFHPDAVWRPEITQHNTRYVPPEER